MVTFSPAYPLSAKTRWMNGKMQREARRSGPPPSRSWMLAGCGSSTRPRPSVSTSAWRLRPLTQQGRDFRRQCAVGRDYEVHKLPQRADQCSQQRCSNWRQYRNLAGRQPYPLGCPGYFEPLPGRFVGLIGVSPPCPILVGYGVKRNLTGKCGARHNFSDIRLVTEVVSAPCSCQPICRLARNRCIGFSI